MWLKHCNKYLEFVSHWEIQISICLLRRVNFIRKLIYKASCLSRCASLWTSSTDPLEKNGQVWKFAGEFKNELDFSLGFRSDQIRSDQEKTTLHGAYLCAWCKFDGYPNPPIHETKRSLTIIKWSWHCIF